MGSPVLMLCQPAGESSIFPSQLVPPVALSVAAQPTYRLIDSELYLNYSGSMSVGGGSGSVAAVRGCATLSSATTVASGYEYGVQGKLILQGTLNNGSGFNAGIFGQVDTSNANFAHTSGYLAPIMGDFGATANLATDANAYMEALLNTTACLIHSVFQVEARASYLMDITDDPTGGYGAQYCVAAQASGLASMKLKVHVKGTDYYIPLYTS
ncbi:MAG: hypothetical protein ABSE84_01595 [Isosphaeraceae bacterium]|jgi:hypothetical protein